VTEMSIAPIGRQHKHASCLVLCIMLTQPGIIQVDGGLRRELAQKNAGHGLRVSQILYNYYPCHPIVLRLALRNLLFKTFVVVVALVVQSVVMSLSLKLDGLPCMHASTIQQRDP